MSDNQSYSVPLQEGAPSRIVITDRAPNSPLILIPSMLVNLRFNLTHMRFTLTTDANAANRTPRFTIPNTVLNPYEYATQILHPANVAAQYFIHVSNVYDTFGLGLDNFVTIPDIFKMFPPDFLFTMSIDNMQAGDVISDIQLFGRQWVQRTD